MRQIRTLALVTLIGLTGAPAVLADDAGPSAGGAAMAPPVEPPVAPGATEAQPAPEAQPPEKSPEQAAGALAVALQQSRWLAAFGGALVLLVWLLRAFIGKWLPWFKSKLGGLVLGAGTAGLMVVGVTLADGGSLDAGLLGTALAAVWTTAGQWGHIKDARD